MELRLFDFRRAVATHLFWKKVVPLPCIMTEVAVQHGSVLTFPWIKFLKPSHASVKPAKHSISSFETRFICNQQWNLYTEHISLQKEFFFAR